MTRNFCVHCGVELAAGATGLVCLDCTSWLRDGEARYTLLWEGSRSEGPVAFSAVVERLQRGILGDRDRISGRGSGYVRVDQHPDFAPFFIPGDPRHEKLNADRASAQREAGARVRSRAMRRLVRLAVAAGVLATPLVIWKSGVLDAHQDTIDAWKAKMSVLFDEGATTVRKAVDQKAADEELRQSMGLPGEDVVAALGQKYAGATGQVSERLDLAKVGMLQGTDDGLEAARRELEYALVLAPKNVEVLGHLAVVYTALSDREAELGSRGLTLYARASALAQGDPLLLRAGAGMALVAGGYPDALAKGEQCVAARADDPFCRWYLGEALAQTGRFEESVTHLEQAAAAFGDAPAVQLALARAGIECFRYGGAERALLAHAERFPDDAGVQALLARLYREIGRFDEAVTAASRAYNLDKGRPEMELLRGQLLILGLNRPREGVPVLLALSQAPGISSELRAAALLHASIGAQRGGQGAEAVEAARKMLDLVPGSPAGHIALAKASLAAGDPAGAEMALKDVDTTGSSDVEGAAFHLEAAQVYTQLDRPRLASFEIASAKEARPDWVVVRLLDAQNQLDLDNGAGAVAALDETWFMDVEQDAGRDPIVDIPVTPISAKKLADRIAAQIPAGSALGQSVPPVLGMLEAVECLTAGKDCATADRRLDAALELKADSRLAVSYKARLDVRAKRAEAAVKRLEVLAASEEPHPVILALLMRARALMGLRTDVDELLGRIGRLTPDGTRVAWHHALALEAMGERDAAIAKAAEAVRADPAALGIRQYLLEMTRK